ncbi:MAG: patatin-like phospholipase family protein [Dehalococcoidia bacterium]
MTASPLPPSDAALLTVTVGARRIWTPAQPEWATNEDVASLGEFTAVVERVLGRAATPIDRNELPWRTETTFGPAAALRAAIEVQHGTRELPRSSGTPVHAAIAITFADEPLEGVIDVAQGGQVVCTDRAYRVLHGLEASDYYRWNRLPGAMWECAYETPLALLEAPFERMFAAEVHEWVSPRRAALGDSRGELESPFAPDVRNELFGVALSGGGMRSAIFSLGVLQALARNELLASADYISSVSGGGYVAASLAGLGAERLPYEGLERLAADYAHFPFAYPQALTHGVERPRSMSEATTQARRLPVHGNEAPALWHIRKYANLLGSGIGLFDLTTWLSVGRYLASTVALWLLFLLPVLAVIALLVLPPWFALWDRAEALRVPLVLAPVVAGILLLLALGSVTVIDRRLGQRAGLLRVLRVLTAIEAVALLTLFAGGGAWLIEHGAAVYERVATSGAFAGALLSAVGARFVSATGRWKSLAARLAIQAGGFLLLAGTAIWAIWFAGYLMGATGRGPLPAWAEAATLLAALAFTALAIATILLSLRSPEFAPGLLNRLSLHDLYEARIQQTWIISARKPGTRETGRDEASLVGRWSGVWPAPDLSLRSLVSLGEPRMPYPLFCAALSLPGSRGEKLPERKADSFLIAPVYSGSATTRWSRTSTLPDLRDMPLARAAAISGAVIAPNMGERTSTSMSIITTLLNIRIGRWIRNPRPARRGRWPRLGQLAHVLYLREMLGQATREDMSVYLSDGGHFDNLGVYELFRRHCRYIVAVSADLESPGRPDRMGNLGSALRMARVDFGAEVTLGPLRPLLRDPSSGRVLSQYLVGRIRYPRMPIAPNPGTDLRDEATRSNVNSGIFVFIKCGLADDHLSADLLQYLGSNPSFPYDPTTDQQFDQPQFESYRQLGFLAAQAMFDEHPDSADPTVELRARFDALMRNSPGTD